MLCPLARRSATTCRISSIVSTCCILEAVFGVGVRAVANVARPGANRISNLLRHLGVALQKLWRESVVEAEHVGQHQHLTVASRAGPDSDRRDADRPCDSLRYRGGHQLEHDRERASLLQTLCFG